MELITLVEFGTVITTLLLILSGLPLCMDIWKSKNAKFFPAGLFIYFLAAMSIMSAFAYYSNDNFSLYLRIFSTAMVVIYLSIYAIVERNLSRFKIYAAAMLTFLVGVFSYVSRTPVEQRADTLGAMGGSMFTLMNLAPIIDIYNTIKSGDTRNIVVPVLIAGTLNCTNWMAYGILRNDPYTAVPNIPSLLINVIQFALLFYFGKPEPLSKKID